MNLEKKRWKVLFACCFINLCLGATYAWSVFSAAMAEYFNSALGLHVTAGELAVVYTIANSLGPITMITGGWFNDKFGPKRVILAGGMMWGLGLFLSGFAHSVGFLIVTYGLIGGLGEAMAYGSTISTCVKFFPDKRGLIGGIATAVYGMSSVILPPVITAVVQQTNAAFAFKAIGITFVILIAGASVFLEQCPQEYKPAGWEPVFDGAVTQPKNLDWKEMLRTPVFYVMLLLLTCGAFSGMMVISQASSIAQNMIGMTPKAAGLVVSVLAFFNAFGRIAAGFLSDKLGRIHTLMAACVLAVGGLLCLFCCGQGRILLFYVGLSAVGISFGSFMGVYPGFTADQFGPQNNSVNYGIMFIGFALAGYFGPQLMHKVFTATGAYQQAFLVASGFAAAGVIFTIIYKILAKKA